MKRDMALIRRLLLHLEEYGDFPQVIDMSDRPLDVLRHIGLMVDAGFVGGIEVEESIAGVKAILLKPEPHITWSGYEFLDAARDDAVWNKAMSRTAKVSGSVGYAVLVKMLADLTLEQLGFKS